MRCTTTERRDDGLRLEPSNVDNSRRHDTEWCRSATKNAALLHTQHHGRSVLIKRIIPYDPKYAYLRLWVSGRILRTKIWRFQFAYGNYTCFIYCLRTTVTSHKNDKMLQYRYFCRRTFMQTLESNDKRLFQCKWVTLQTNNNTPSLQTMISSLAFCITHLYVWLSYSELTTGFQLSMHRTSKSQAAQSRCTVVRPMRKSIGKWEIRPPVKS